MKAVTAVFALLLAGCSGSGPSVGKPELPQSIAPGWTQQNYAESPAPAGLPPASSPPKCWLANYMGPVGQAGPAGQTSEAQAEVHICAFQAEAPALDAAQRFPSAANTVKFQIQKRFIVIRWSGANQTDATALVRATQRALQK